MRFVLILKNVAVNRAIPDRITRRGRLCATPTHVVLHASYDQKASFPKSEYEKGWHLIMSQSVTNRGFFSYLSQDGEESFKTLEIFQRQVISLELWNASNKIGHLFHFGFNQFLPRVHGKRLIYPFLDHQQILLSLFPFRFSSSFLTFTGGSRKSLVSLRSRWVNWDSPSSFISMFNSRRSSFDEMWGVAFESSSKWRCITRPRSSSCVSSAVKSPYSIRHRVCM